MSRKCKVLIVGSNPSVKSPNNSAFHPSTRSRMILDEWFKDIDAELHFINVCDRTRPGNRQMRVSEIRECLPSLKSKIKMTKLIHCRVVAVGRTASKALNLLGVEYLEMPHPSGMNRKLNDKEYVASKICELKRFIYERREDITNSQEDTKEV